MTSNNNTLNGGSPGNHASPTTPTNPASSPGRDVKPSTAVHHTNPTDSTVSTVHPPPPMVTPPAADPKTTRLQAQISKLQSQIASTQAQLDEAKSKLTDPHAEGTVRRHIKLLHDYNEIKDVGQGLMGLIADSRGVRVREVMEEFGVTAGD